MRPTHLRVPAETETWRVRLQADPFDPVACTGLSERAGTIQPEPAAQVVREVCDVLHQGVSAGVLLKRERRLPLLGKNLRESLIIHPREKEQRHHQLASLLGRVMHLLQGDATARAILRVTERATPESYPAVLRLTGACGRALELPAPDVRIARGEDPLFVALVDRTPYLCLHRDWIDRSAPSTSARLLTTAELLFALGRAIAHIKSGHTALLQLGSECLETLVLDQVPFLVRTPLKLAGKAAGAARINVAVKRMGSMLPDQSRGRRAVDTLGNLLPDKEQETFLPETVHEWVRSWVQGVEYSADRAGFLLAGSTRAAISAMLALSPALSEAAAGTPDTGLAAFLTTHGDRDRSTADRARELLRFALSLRHLDFVAAQSMGVSEMPI